MRFCTCVSVPHKKRVPLLTLSPREAEWGAPDPRAEWLQPLHHHSVDCPSQGSYATLPITEERDHSHAS